MSKGSRRHIGGKQKNRQRELMPAFHILCEGKNTEPLYFNQFPISTIAHCKGYGQTSLKLVETAIEYKMKNNIKKKTVDQIWVVFDYDFDADKQQK